MNAIARKDTLEELVGHRSVALAKYQEAIEALTEARAAAHRACIGAQVTFTDRDLESHFFGYGKPDDVGVTARASLDRAMWRALVVNTPLFSLMDVQERKAFEESLTGTPPEVTVEALMLNIERLTGDANMIFRRGLVNAFRTLSRDYRSHDGFKLGGRVVLTYIVSNYGGGYYTFNHNAEDRLRDIDRVMHVLDGKEEPGRQTTQRDPENPEPDYYMQGLCASLRSAITRGGDDIVETAYFRVRWFKNGNAHLWFLRPDLVEKANRIIAEHYGATLGAGADAATPQPVFDPDRPGLKEDFFATPDTLADRMVALAGIGAGMRVLEPSAGEGAIVKSWLRQQERPEISLFACEANEGRYEALRTLVNGRDGFGSRYYLPKDLRLLHGDFLRSYETHRFDRIVMNPPFSGGQALAHLFRAWDRLAPGGRIVAILPGSFGGSSQRARAKFTAFENSYTSAQYELPAGTFQESGTMVRTGLWVFDKPAMAQAERLAA